MKLSRFFCFLLSAVLLLTASAVASGEQNNYDIIGDSDSRYLTEAELWDWQYEALGYIYNELFARHGRSFRPGEKYDVYFRSQAWYSVNPDYHYGLLNKFEQANEKLVHQVLQDMRAQKTANPAGKPLPRSNEEAELNTVLAFRSYKLAEGQKLSVYTGPGVNYYRSANGKASVSTNEKVKIAGRENGWLAIEYETNGGSRRVGYVLERSLKEKLDVENLEFYNDDGLTATACSLTDEPDGSETSLIRLAAETPLTLLGPYATDSSYKWAYVEVETDQGPMRGFVLADCVTGSPSEYYFEKDAADDGRYDWEDENRYTGEVG